VLDTETGREFVYCREHEPPLPVGERSPKLVIERWRMPPDSLVSQALASPKESAKHQSLRAEMCDCGLLGGDGACRYYLSIITGRDEFAAWSDEFADDAKKFVVSRTCPAASQFCNENSIQFLVGFFRAECERFEGTYGVRRITKMERAIELLLQHPEWTDERIASHVPTTVKQLQRCTDFKALRAVAKRPRA
jgi:hypothetical protein